MEKIRIVQYGCTEINKHMLRYLCEKGAQVVGVVDEEERFWGMDAGEYAGLARPLGVKIAQNLKQALEQSDAQVVLMAQNASLSDSYEQFALCLEKGINVITTCSQALYAWSTDPLHINRLDRIAKAHGARFLATGIQDLILVHLPALLCAGCVEIEQIHLQIQCDIEQYGRGVCEACGVGLSVDAERHGIGAFPCAPEEMWVANEALAAKLNLSVKSQKRQYELLPAAQDVYCRTLGCMIAPGENLGVKSRVETRTMQGVTLLTTLTSKVYQSTDVDLCRVKIQGEPAMAVCVQSYSVHKLTCAALIARIPALMRQRAGVVTVDELGSPCHLSFPMACYV